MADLDPVVGEADGGGSHQGEDHEGARAAERHARDGMGAEEPDDHGHDDADAAHGGRARLGDVDLWPVLADVLADVVTDEPPDEERRRQDGDPEGHAPRRHERDHVRSPAPARPRARHASTRSSKGTVTAPRGLGRPRGPCRPRARRRRPGRGEAPRRSPSVDRPPPPIRLRPACPNGPASMMAVGSSERGLSEVSTTTSARRSATAPISGRFPGSRSPPHPNRQTTRPLWRGRGRPSTRREAGRRMGVVHHDGEGWPGLDDLHPSADRLGCRQSLCHLVLVHAEDGGHRGRHEGVVEVEDAGQRSGHRPAPPPEATWPDGTRATSDGVGATHRGHGQTHDPPSETAPPRIVDTDDGMARRRRCEQLGLGREVLLHRAVVVEMVAAQVGEGSHVEDQPVDAVLRQRVRRNLHGHGPLSLVA